MFGPRNHVGRAARVQDGAGGEQQGGGAAGGAGFQFPVPLLGGTMPLMDEVGLPGEVTVRLRLSPPLPLRASGFTFDAVVNSFCTRIDFIPDAHGGLCSNVVVITHVDRPYRWSRRQSEGLVPLIRLEGGARNPIENPADRAVMILHAILEFGALEAHRPEVSSAFGRGERDRVVAIFGTDSDGNTLHEASMLSAGTTWVEGYVTSDPPPAFPSPLLARALPHAMADGGPHWEFWSIGYFVTLNAELQHGHPQRLRREAVSTFQTALEAALITEQAWPEDAQYNDEAIQQFPSVLQAELRSLYLTRNLMLHRGAVLRRVLRPGEKMADARKRSRDDSDGLLSGAHLRAFAEAVFEALLWIELPTTDVYHPKKAKRMKP